MIDPAWIHLFGDRYGGCYSDGEWIAVYLLTPPGEHSRSRLDRALEACGSDTEAMNFWHDVKTLDIKWIAVGDTPEEAIAKLNDQNPT